MVASIVRTGPLLRTRASAAYPPMMPYPPSRPDRPIAQPVPRPPVAPGRNWTQIANDALTFADDAYNWGSNVYGTASHYATQLRYWYGVANRVANHPISIAAFRALSDQVGGPELAAIEWQRAH